jgi:hypothetical protein
MINFKSGCNIRLVSRFEASNLGHGVNSTGNCLISGRSPQSQRLQSSAGIRFHWLIWILLVSALTGAGQLAGAAELIQKLSFPHTDDIERADFYFLKSTNKIRAVLVLCPGDNDNGLLLIKNPTWQVFAAQNEVGLIGISYASDPKYLARNQGYYTAGKISGSYLLQAVKQAYGTNLPMLIYGFSGGAHFTSNFIRWSPNRVLAWCAYSAAWWDDPIPSQAAPPGIVVCGELDGSRYTASFNFFEQGRQLGKSWTWLSLAETGHEISHPLDDFVRQYFAAILVDRQPVGGWYDINTKAHLDDAAVEDYPLLACWLPDEAVATTWTRLHSP